MASMPAGHDKRFSEISRALLDARCQAGSLTEFPGQLPATLDEAYKVQAVSRAKWPDTVIGWKVGGIPPVHREALGADFLSGPIFAQRFVLAREDEVSPMPVFADGFAAIEPEFVLKLGDARDEDELYIGAEIASSPLVDINDIGPLAVVCDFGNNNGVLLGNEIEGWRELRGYDVQVTTTIDGVNVAQRLVNDLPGDVVKARDFLFAHAERQDISLPAGTLISTGAITGVHEAQVGARSVLQFGDLGSLQLQLVAAEPETCKVEI